jgi:hypothetical protein
MIIAADLREAQFHLDQVKAPHSKMPGTAGHGR